MCMEGGNVQLKIVCMYVHISPPPSPRLPLIPLKFAMLNGKYCYAGGYLQLVKISITNQPFFTIRWL